MLKFFQSEWFGIRFSSFGEPNPERMADASFYDCFYTEFNQRFRSFADLPADWRAEKDLVVGELLRLTDASQRFLSIGCGNGYVESRLAAGGRNVLALEPTKMATALLGPEHGVEVVHGYFPAALPDPQERFPVIYMGAIDYVMTDEELLSLLRQAYAHATGSLFLISASVEDRSSPLRALKRRIRGSLCTIPSINRALNRRKQLWGYMRTEGELVALMEKAEFVISASRLLRPDLLLLKGDRHP